MAHYISGVRKDSSTGTRKPSQGWQVPPFLLSGWAILLVVLLSATPAGEQIRLRAVGSAFDPAAAAVALGPKKQKVEARQLVSSRTDLEADGPDLAPVPAIVPPAELLHPAHVAGQQTLARVSFVAAPVKPPARPQAAR